MIRQAKIDSRQKAISAEALDVRSKDIRSQNVSAASMEALLRQMVAKTRAAAGGDSPVFTGTPAADTAAVDTHTNQLATTAFVINQLGTDTPNMDGTGAAGSSLRGSRQDHTHPTDTSRASATHNHDAAYAAIGHNHNSTYAPLVHNHDSSYAALGHNHDAAYSAIGHTHPTDTTRAPVDSPTFTGDLRHSIIWDDLQGPANAALIGASAPTNEAYRDTPARLLFLRSDQDDELTFTFQTSHRWIRDTEVRVHVHYIPMVTPAADQVVRLSYAYVWAHPNSAVPALASWTTGTVDITIPSSGADTFNEKLAGLFNTTPTGSKESSILIVALSRLGTSASDSYTTSKATGTAQANFCILSVDCHYQSNKEGTADPIPA